MTHTQWISKLSSVRSIEGILPDGEFSVSTDSRSYQKGQVFVALKGDNFDGMQFVKDVLLTGCPICVCTDCAENRERVQALQSLHPSTCYIMVSDTLLFIQEWAEAHILNWLSENPSRRLIGITGSNGKTTHKEMLFHLLNEYLPGKVLCTYKNLNNHIGVPLTLFRVNESIQIAIIEMGTNHPGEIKRLCQIAHPNAGLITNIGSAHLEFLGDENGVLTEKRALYDHVMRNTAGRGEFIVLRDDRPLATLPLCQGTRSIGKNEDNDFQIRQGTQSIAVSFAGRQVVLENENLVGEHNFSNLAVCFAMAVSMFPKEAELFEKAASSFLPKDNRSMWKSYQGRSLFFDAYNANPSSMRFSLKGFRDFLREKAISVERSLVVMADMNELGPRSDEFHRELGQYLDELGLPEAVFIGRFASRYAEGFRGKARCFESAEVYKAHAWHTDLERFDYVFVKGSRSLQLESLIE